MPILESNDMRAIFQNKVKEKDKMFENLGKNVLSVKIFFKKATTPRMKQLQYAPTGKQYSQG